MYGTILICWDPVCWGSTGDGFWRWRDLAGSDCVCCVLYVWWLWKGELVKLCAVNEFGYWYCCLAVLVVLCWSNLVYSGFIFDFIYLLYNFWSRLRCVNPVILRSSI